MLVKESKAILASGIEQSSRYQRVCRMLKPPTASDKMKFVHVNDEVGKGKAGQAGYRPAGEKVRAGD